MAAGPDVQVLVLGGGPAGARAAQRLASAGADVLMLEAEDYGRNKLCSGLLNHEGQVALGCELPQSVRREPFEPRLEFHDLDSRLRRRYSPGYWNMDRPAFDAWLCDCAAEAGVRIEYGRRASRIECGPAGPQARVGSDVISARVVLDATGWRALSRKLLAPPELRSAPVVHAFQGSVHCDLPADSMWALFESDTTQYYGWLVPKGAGSFLLGAGFPQGADSTRREGDAALESDPDPWKKLSFVEASVAAAAGEELQHLDAKPLGCPITTITSTQQLWWGRELVFPLGEAAGLVSPSSGDGIHFGLEQANALADALSSSGLLEGRSSAGCSAQDSHQGMLNQVQARLRPALAELRFNCIKAWVAARPGPRRLAAQFMGLYLRRPVEQLAPVAVPAAEAQ
ncbi:FAD-dependent monooxygenase [bacterium]|nr:FAD-dependent monooxygenase [bacterium]